MNMGGSLQRKWLIFLVLSGYFFYSIMQLSLFNVAGPYLLTSYHLSSATLGGLSSLYLYSLAIILLPAGYVLDKYSVRWFCIITLLLSLLSGVVLASFHAVWAIACYRILTGMANGFAFLAGLRVSALLFPKKSSLMTGLFVALGMSGGIVASNLYAFVATNSGWPMVFTVNVSIGFLFWVLMLLLLDNARKYDAVSLQTVRQVTSKVGFLKKINWVCGIYAGILNLSVYLLASLWANIYLLERYHISNAQASIISSMIFLGVIVGSPAMGFLADYFNLRKPLMFLSALLAALVMFGIIYMPAFSLIILCVLFLLLGFFTSSQVLVYPVVANNNPKKQLSLATGFIAILMNVIGAVGQSVFGWVIALNWSGLVINSLPSYSKASVSDAIMIVPIVFLVASLLSVFMFKNRTSQNLN